MPVLDIPMALTPGGYTCVICENPLIAAAETTCGHTFCRYCINLWKRYHARCPVCTNEIGLLRKRQDIDDSIGRFFATANSAVCDERCKTIQLRNECEKLVFGDYANSGDEMKALMEHYKLSDNPLQKTGSASGNSKTNNRKKDLVRMLNVTERFERQLETVYSKILTVGEKLTDREDQAVVRLCGAAVGGLESPLSFLYQNCSAPATAATSGHQRPFSADSKQNGTNIFGTSQNFGKVDMVNSHTKDKQEIDALIELTDDVLNIDSLLQKFSFTNLTNQAIETLEDDLDIEDECGGIPYLTDESIQKTTDKLLKDFDYNGFGIDAKFEIHPEVQKHLDKLSIKVNSISTKTKSCRPATPFEDVSPLMRRTRATKKESLLPPINQNRLQKTSSIDLTNNILQCRESLLNLRLKYEQYDSPKPSFAPMIYSSRSSIQEEEDEIGAIGAYGPTFGPTGDTDATASRSPPRLGRGRNKQQLDQSGEGYFEEHTIRKIGREPVRPGQKVRRHLPTTLIYKKLQVEHVASLPDFTVHDTVSNASLPCFPEPKKSTEDNRY